jgi:hypothetical protein
LTTLAWTKGSQKRIERRAITAAVPTIAAAMVPEGRSLRPKLGEPLKMMAMVRTAPTRKKIRGAVYKPHLVGSSRMRTPNLIRE